MNARRAEELAEQIYTSIYETMGPKQAAALLLAELSKERELCAERAVEWWTHDPGINGVGAIARMKAAILREEEE